MSSLVRSALIVYALAVVMIAALIFIQPGDNMTMIGHIVLLATTVLGVIRSSQNGRRLTELHDAVNGQTTERVKEAHAAGVAAGRAAREGQE